MLTFSPACGACRFCLEGRANLCLDAAAGLDSGFLRDGSTRLSRDGVRVHHLAYVSSFASHAVVPANGALPIDRRARSRARVPARVRGHDRASCRVTRRANVRPGDAVAIFACGGVGLSAVHRGRSRLGASDRSRSTRSPRSARWRSRLGATHALDPADGDPVEQIRAIVPGGVDVAFEALGRPEVADQAFRSVRYGGTTVLIGQPPMGVKAGFDVYDATQFEHTILGSNLGGAVPALHVPVLARLAVAGKLAARRRSSRTASRSTRSTRRSRRPRRATPGASWSSRERSRVDGPATGH